MMTDDRYEVLVIGGGPAGLSAALTLARYERRVAVFDTNRGRSTWHQINDNYLGFPGGIAARDLRARGREQLTEYPHVTLHPHQIDELQRRTSGFVACGQGREWHGGAVIICTGVVDHYPHFDGWPDYVGRSMGWCITCDGYSARGKRVVVVGNTNQAVIETLQLTRFTDKLTLLTDSHSLDIDAEHQVHLARHAVPLVHDRIGRVEGTGGYVSAIETQGRQRLDAERIFSEFGATPRTQLANDLGVELTALGYIVADSEQKTGTPGVFAAGDLTHLHGHQIATAVHEGSQAASAANSYLYALDLRE